LDKRNSLREKADKQKWMKDQKKWLQEYVKTHSRKPGGTRKKWVHNEANRAYIVKNGRGGINWYRYQKKILEDKLLPFIKECELERLGIIVQEDNAPAHSSKYQRETFSRWHVLRMT
jgi:hypothetical protein